MRVPSPGDHHGREGNSLKGNSPGPVVTLVGRLPLESLTFLSVHMYPGFSPGG